MTRAYQDALGGGFVFEGKRYRDSTEVLLKLDPETLDLALGCLFDFEPEN